MGELDFEQKALIKVVDGAIAEQQSQAGDLRVATSGGRFQVRWDVNGSASDLGQLAFFAEFQEVSGLFDGHGPYHQRRKPAPGAPTTGEVKLLYGHQDGVDIRRHVWRPSPLARCDWPGWRDRLSMPVKPGYC